MLKALVIGCGKIAGIHGISMSTHGGAYTNNERIDIVACCDTDTIKRKKFSKLYQCEAEESIELALCKYHPDVVSVCTPDETHFDIMKILFRSISLPKVIFVEKPVCKSETELDQLMSLSQRYGIPIVANHSRRFDKHHQELRERISSGEFGDIVSVNVTYYSGWEHNGVHAVDTLSFLFDDEIKINHIVGKENSPYVSDYTLDVKASFINRCADIKIESFDEGFYQLFEFEMRFTKARLRIEDFGARVLLEDKYTNSMGENVIKLVDNKLAVKKLTPMQQAISTIVNSIEKKNFLLLDGFLLQDISKTMTTIWEGTKMADMT